MIAYSLAFVLRRWKVPLLYVYANDEPTATVIEDDFSLLIADIASRILKQEIEVVLVLPKVLQ